MAAGKHGCLWALARAALAAIGLGGALTAYYLWPTAHIPRDKPVTKIIVEKGARRLLVMSGDERLATFKVSLGHQPVGAKQCEGDNKTPEGLYTLGEVNRGSKYHLSLPVSYPAPKDRCPTGGSLGGDVMIHGLPNETPWLGRFHRFHDWTRGCIAVTNQEIEELAAVVKPGTPIEIRP
jgi:murein L,D-transpeptidase YafK